MEARVSLGGIRWEAKTKWFEAAAESKKGALNNGIGDLHVLEDSGRDSVEREGKMQENKRRDASRNEGEELGRWPRKRGQHG